MRNVLVICDNNAGLSVIVEALLNERSKGAWRAFSAGALPSAHVNRHVVHALRQSGIVIDPQSKPKSWLSYATAASPRFDVVLTLSEELPFGEMPKWLGAPRMLHWALPDPMAVPSTPGERLAMFEVVVEIAAARVDRFLEDERKVRPVAVQANDNPHDAMLRRLGA